MNKLYGLYDKTNAGLHFNTIDLSTDLFRLAKLQLPSQTNSGRSGGSFLKVQNTIK